VGETQRPSAADTAPDDVLALVRSVPEWSDATPVVSVLHGGITNRNYRVDVSGRSYVIRIPGESTELLGIDRGGEIEAARRAASLGIGPPVFGELPTVGTVITGFVAGSAADAGALLDGDRLERLVGAVAALHGSGPIAHEFPIFRIIERHAVDATAHGVAVPADHDQLAAAMTRIESVFARDAEPAVLCHNDLLPANVLFDDEPSGGEPIGEPTTCDGAFVSDAEPAEQAKRKPDRSERATDPLTPLWLIDYEYAGMNEAMFDLANLSVNAGLDPAADDRVLARYLAKPPTDATRWRLGLMKVVSEMREGMWALVQQGISSLEGFDFAAYAEERLGSCRERLADAELGRVGADA
jgi:thiamine kinase-like enzyme